MANTPTPAPVVNPKTTAIVGAVAALFVLVVAYVPAAKPFCQAAGHIFGQEWCADPIDVQLP